MNLSNFNIRYSHRAKRLQIKVDRLARIEVVVPHGVHEKDVVTFVNVNKEWIQEKQNKALEVLQLNPALSQFPPSEIKLLAIEKTFTVEIIHSLKHCVREEKSVLFVSTSSDEITKKLLTKFLQGSAKKYFTEKMLYLSRELNLPFNRLFIRSQKTRWGSCSSKNNININRNLLFLQNDLVEYLMIHELCHTVHMNHSKKYWSLVAARCSDYRSLDKLLNTASNSIPHWAIS